MPSGSSLAVSREEFSKDATDAILSTGIRLIKEEVKDLELLLDDNDVVVVASGPHTSPSLSDSIRKIVGEDSFYFYDAIAPIVRLDSLDMDVCFRASRYSKSDKEDSDGDYINSPFR